MGLSTGTSADSKWRPTWYQSIRMRMPRGVFVLLGVLLFVALYIGLFAIAYTAVSAVLIFLSTGIWRLAAFGVGLTPMVWLYRRHPPHSVFMLAGTGLVLLAMDIFLFINASQANTDQTWSGQWGWPIVTFVLGAVAIGLATGIRLTATKRETPSPAPERQAA